MEMTIGRLRKGLLVLALVVLSSMFIAALVVEAQTAGNGITAPADGAVVRGTVDVKGVANSPTFAKWQLDLLPGGNQNAAIFLALGTVPGPMTYTLDTTAWPDGPHALRLRVVRPDGNYDETITKFTIANKAPAPGQPTGTRVSTGTVASRVTITPTRAATTASPRTSLGVSPIATPAVVQGPPPNGIISPQNGANVKGSVTVTGRAAGPEFQKWQLDLLPGGNSNAAIFLGYGTTPGVFTYTLNSTLYPDGRHALRLRNVRRDSNYDEYTNAITITNQSAVAPAAASGAATRGAPAPTATSGGRSQ